MPELVGQLRWLQLPWGHDADGLHGLQGTEVVLGHHGIASVIAGQGGMADVVARDPDHETGLRICRRLCDPYVPVGLDLSQPLRVERKEPMMGLRGEINLTGAEGPQTMLVFDDGVIVGEPSKAGRAGLAFGAIGGMLGGLASEVSGRRLAKAIADVVSALPEPSAEGVASQVNRTRLFRIDEVSGIRLEKGLGKTRKLVIATTDGKQTVYRFGIPMQPQAPVSDLLGGLFGARFHDAVRTSR